MADQVTGGCLCGKVRFQADRSFGKLFFCHCDQCRKMTGSNHASNLFTQAEKFSWLSGEESVKRYRLPDRLFSTAFCDTCGSGLPFLNSRKTHMIVPAGALDDEPSFREAHNIFCSEQPHWSQEGDKAPRHKTFPE
ncbi:GFA family protein [Rhodovibrionaceae bacterium A322]